MEDPMKDDPRFVLPLRYIELPPKEQAYVAIRLFKRLGYDLATFPKGGRHPNEEEMFLLEEQDFVDVLR